MTYAILAASSLLAVAIAAALMREYRLRLAIESLLKKLEHSIAEEHTCPR